VWGRTSKGLDREVIFRYTEVVHPPAGILGEFLVTILHGDEPASSGQAFDPSLEFAEGLVRPSDFGPLKVKPRKLVLSVDETRLLSWLTLSLSLRSRKRVTLSFTRSPARCVLTNMTR